MHRGDVKVHETPLHDAATGSGTRRGRRGAERPGRTGFAPRRYIVGVASDA